MNNDYWLLAPFVATSLIAVALALVAKNSHDSYERLLKAANTNFNELLQSRDKAVQQIRDIVDHERLTLCYVDGLEEYADLVALLNVDLHDALLDAQNEIKALHRQTVEIPSTIAPVPARPKRTVKKKVEVQE